MNTAYHYIGFVVFWGLVLVSTLFILYWLIIIIQMLIIWSKHTNYYKFHIQRMEIKTDSLRKSYSTKRILSSKNNKRYILLFRLRNIKKFNQSQ